MSEQEIGGAELAEKLQSVLSDPESMGRIMQMASALSSGGMFGGNPAEENVSDDAERAASAEETEKKEDRPKKTPPIKGGGRHTALLCALKPYMNSEKQDRIDKMLRLMQIAELASGMLHS